MADKAHAGKELKSPSAGAVILMVATRKGLWLYHGDAARKTWRVDGPHFLGHIISHVVLDPRDGRTLLAAAKTGHLGPTVFRSTDLGRTWKEAAKPPAFAKAADGSAGRAVDHTFWLTPGHADQKDVWYAGTSPQGLFRSEDGGVTWAPFSTMNDDPRYLKWMGSAQDGTPDGPKLHSIIVDPRDAGHFYFAMSSGGVHESTDGGQTWAPLVKGLDTVEGLDPNEISFQDPHCVRLCPSNPDRLYQQNHCGIYRLDRPSDVWVRIGKNMPQAVGDIGFPMVIHPRDADTAWVFPMDGATVWPRTSPEGKPAVYATRDGGTSWQRHNAGLPDAQAWWTVKRQGDDCGRAGSRRSVFRHHERRAVDERRRRPAVDVHCAPPAGDLFGGSSRALKTPMKVMIPGALRSYTEHGVAEASGATLGAVLSDLDVRYPGIRFRMIDEQDRIRRHIRIFVNGDQARDLGQPLHETDEVVIVQALSGG